MKVNEIDERKLCLNDYNYTCQITVTWRKQYLGDLLLRAEVWCYKESVIYKQPYKWFPSQRHRNQHKWQASGGLRCSIFWLQCHLEQSPDNNGLRPQSFVVSMPSYPVVTCLPRSSQNWHQFDIGDMIHRSNDHPDFIWLFNKCLHFCIERIDS